QGRITEWIMYYIHKAIHLTLIQMHDQGKLIYKGKEFIGDKSAADSELSENEIILDDELHGPCVRLRVGGRLCTADVDLGYCVFDDGTDTEMEESRNIVLPGSAGWIQSVYHPGCRIDEHHRKIVMILKYVMSVCNKGGSCLTNFSSHAFKCLVYVHQGKCENDSETFEMCMHDILVRISFLISVPELLSGDWSTYKDCRERKWAGKLPDIDKKEKNLLNHSPWLMDQLFVIVLFRWFCDSLNSLSERCSGQTFREQLSVVCAEETLKFVKALQLKEYKGRDCDPFNVLKRLQGKYFDGHDTNDGSDNLATMNNDPLACETVTIQHI
ncbi:unnamed protein product, partial [Owenia fusiformis]